MKVSEIYSEMLIEIHESVELFILCTMIIIKQLKVIYFDRQFISLTSTNTLDSQIILLRDQVHFNSEENLIYNEIQKVLELYEFLKDFKIDETVKMNAEFEIIFYNYIKTDLQKLFVSNMTVLRNEIRERN